MLDVTTRDLLRAVAGHGLDGVERTLSAWRVPRARNPATGDVTHPSMVYVVGAGGRLEYALGADPAVIVAAVDELSFTTGLRVIPCVDPCACGGT